jgi:RimJ/RimL family protein N-acetyltransferase
VSSATTQDLRTERLVLCPTGLADIDEFVTLHADREVARFVRSLDRLQAEERLELAEREWAERGHGMFAVRDRDTNRFLGRVGLKYWPQSRKRRRGRLLALP